MTSTRRRDEAPGEAVPPLTSTLNEAGGADARAARPQLGPGNARPALPLAPASGAVRAAIAALIAPHRSAS